MRREGWLADAHRDVPDTELLLSGLNRRGVKLPMSGPGCRRFAGVGYPQALRDEYGEEMAQLMRDQVSRAWTDRGVFGVFALCVNVLWGTIRSVTAEHVVMVDVHLNRHRLG